MALRLSDFEINLKTYYLISKHESFIHIYQTRLA